MTSLDDGQLLELYRYLYLTRALEERFEKLFKQGHIVGGLYRSLGQEATAVGSAYALEEGDWLAPGIRDLGALLVRGVEPRLMLLQFMARANPWTGGRDNFNHFTVPELGILGPVSPLGDQLCVLNGVAMAFGKRGRDRVCMAYQGEGATRTGASHEGMNFAAARQLPLVVVLEHNRWSFSTPSRREGAVETWTDVSKAYGMPVFHVDGNDVEGVHGASVEAVAHVRSGAGPAMVVAETYRMLGHAQHDPQPYVPEEELERWREKDPLRRFSERLVSEHGFAEDRLAETRSAVDAEIDDAVDEALDTPRPEPEEARQRVYSGPDGAAEVPWTRRSVVGYPDLPASVPPARLTDAGDAEGDGGADPGGSGRGRERPGSGESRESDRPTAAESDG